MKLFDRRDFQNGVLNLILLNEEFMLAHSHVIKANYFKLNAHKAIARIVEVFYRKYHRCINSYEFEIESNRFMNSELAKKLEVTYAELQNLYKEIIALPASDPVWYRDKLIPFAKHREAKSIITRMTSEVDQSDDESEVNLDLFQSLVDSFRDLDRDLSRTPISFFDNLDMLKDIVNKDVIPTPWKTLNRSVQGIDVGELWALLGKTNIGKSNFLTSMGVEALRHRFNVLHISFEDTERKVATRYAAALSDTERNYMEPIIGDVVKSLKKNTEQFGRLFIFKDSSCSVKASQIRSIVQELERKERTIVHLVIIDYASLLKPEPDNRSPDWETLEQSFRVLRDLAQESRKRYLTAFQADKAAESSALIDFKNLGKSYAMAQVVDVSISLNQTREERADGIMRLHIVKLKDGEGVGNTWAVEALHGKCQYPETDKVLIGSDGLSIGETAIDATKNSGVEMENFLEDDI